MSAQQLADKCKQLGMEIPRAVLANLENGRRATVSVAELLVLAEALQVSPLLLAIPLGRQERVEILPDVQLSAFEAAQWWRGEFAWIETSGDGPALARDIRRQGKTPVDWVFDHQDLVHRWEMTRAAAAIARPPASEDGNGWTETAKAHQENLDGFERRLRTLRLEMRAEKLIPPPLPRELAHIDPPVVAAIVTSDLGVLVSRRREGRVRWGFITGEQDAVQDESPKDTAVREVKEETGLRIQAGDVIGERNPHPVTKRHMIYVAAKPTRGTEIAVIDEEELAEVRWVSLAEADELLSGMYEPVREHLAAVLGAGSGS